MALFTLAGAHFYVGTALAIDFTTPATALAAFLADVYTEVTPAETIGDFGDTATDVTFTGIGDSRTQHLKGTKDGGTQQLTCGWNSQDAGQIALKAAFASPNDRNFKIAFNDAPDPYSAVATVTIASPGVFTWTAHGLILDDAVKFSTTGALPTGLTAGTTYYVLSSGLTSNTFQVAATKGGTAIVTTGTQSGIHTGLTVPSPTTVFYRGKVMSFQRVAGTGPNNVLKLQTNIGINSDQIEVISAD